MVSTAATTTTAASTEPEQKPIHTSLEIISDRPCHMERIKLVSRNPNRIVTRLAN